MSGTTDKGSATVGEALLLILGIIFLTIFLISAILGGIAIGVAGVLNTAVSTLPGPVVATGLVILTFGPLFYSAYRVDKSDKRNRSNQSKSPSKGADLSRSQGAEGFSQLDQYPEGLNESKSDRPKSKSQDENSTTAVESNSVSQIPKWETNIRISQLELEHSVIRTLRQNKYFVVGDLRGMDESDLGQIDGINEEDAYSIFQAAKVDKSHRVHSDRQGSDSHNKEEEKQSGQSGSDSNENKNETETEIISSIDSIRSKLDYVDQAIIDGKISEAKELVDEAETELKSVKETANENDINNYDSDLQKLSNKTQRILTKSHFLTTLRNVDPYQFEEFVANVWKKQGWDTRVTSGSADRGVDVIATKKDAFENRRHLIQVKRHGENTTVGSEDIQRYASLYQRDEQVDNVFVVTSNQFTSEAEKVAKRRDVSTVNGEELYEMLTEQARSDG
jgi:HJR/Mrr/RecB family endonuclease